MADEHDDTTPRLIIEEAETFGDPEAEAQVLEALTELSPQTVFQSKGVAILWRTSRDTQGHVQKQQVRIPIRSVDAAQMQQDIQRYITPRRRQLLIRNKAVGNGSAKWEMDENNPKTQELISDQLHLWRLRALDIPLRDASGAIVWHPDNPELQDIPKALQAWRALGFTGAQLNDFDEQVTALSREAEENEKNAF